MTLILTALLLMQPAQAQQPDAPAAVQAGPRVSLAVKGFSTANVEALQAHERALNSRMAAFTESKGLAVAVDYGHGGTLVTVEEVVDLPADGLGLVPVGMGVKALDHRRGFLLATEVNAWVATGPWREAALSGNAALAEALGQRGIVVQLKNGSGDVLMLPYTPGYSGQVTLGSVVYVREPKEAWEVFVHPRDGSLGSPRGADGSPTNTAKLYRWFGEEY
ncbi:MAG: hypothetical protein EP330_00910 [Deltaproteobacteria bacterium]|nr:MAG: hypothetical protein EP330_00910 [Deltaproteobacteria bacterium]